MSEEGSNSTRQWIAAPEMSDDAVRSGSGKGWDEWCDVIDQFGDQKLGHQAIAERLAAEHGVDGWWAQTVTVGYERITGLRQPHQMADGTFTANKSRTIFGDADALRRSLLDDEWRSHVFADVPTELRSKPTSKSIRVAIGRSAASISLEPVGDGRTKVVVQHDGLSTSEAVEEWKGYWSGWLERVGGTTEVDR